MRVATDWLHARVRQSQERPGDR